MSGIASYTENAVSTQTRGRLIVLLYEGAIKLLKQALAELEAGRFVEKDQYVNKAQAIISELNSSVDMEAGGQIAKNLRKLYNFMAVHLDEANMKRDPQRIREVTACLEDLNEGWKAMMA